MLYEDVEVNSEKWLNLDDLLNEEWRDIAGYEGLYKVSSYGRVKSLPVWKRYKKGKILKSNKNRKNGYLKITLCKDGGKISKLVHRIVIKEFIPNFNNLPQINHKDENKENNRIDNLEWCTSKYNINYGYGKYKHAEHLKRKVLQYDINMNFIKEWDSATEAWRSLTIHKNNIMKCCKKQQKTAGGYIWRYADDSTS